MIKEIKKELEKIPVKKDQIKFLVDKLNKTKDKELKDQIQNLINEIIKEEDLEERIEIQQQPVVPVKIRKFESEIQEQPAQTRSRIEEKEDEPKIINYQTAATRIVDYNTQVRELSTSLETSNPIQRDPASNLTRAQMVDAFYELQERKVKNQGYMTAHEEMELFKLPDPVDPIEIHKQGFNVLDILQRKKDQHIKPKYELH